MGLVLSAFNPFLDSDIFFNLRSIGTRAFTEEDVAPSAATRIRDAFFDLAIVFLQAEAESVFRRGYMNPDGSW